MYDETGGRITMSILINGMEMPKDEEMLCINIYPDGKVCINLDLECKRIANAVPVPPHGRLIEEADAIETAWMILRGLGYRKEENPQLEKAVREVFATAPTIEVE